MSFPQSLGENISMILSVNISHAPGKPHTVKH